MIIALLLVWPAAAQKTKKEEGTVVFQEGITYALPRTGVHLVVKAARTQFVPGPYAAYADQFLGIKEARMQPQTTWEIEEVTFSSFAEPDPAQVYKSRGGAAAMLQLTADGCLAGLNSKGGVVETVKPETGNFLPKAASGKLSFFNLTDSPYFTQGDSTNNYRSQKLGIEQKAAQAAARILQCRTARFETAAGLLDEFHPDGEAYEESLEELEKIEHDNLALFIGKQQKESYTFRFDYVPQNRPVKGEVVFRFDESRGILPKTDLSGKPVMLEMERDENLASKQEGFARSDNPAAGAGGVYYRLPGVAEVKLIRELTVIATTRLTVAQFGTVAPLPEELLDGNHSVEFHPETGAIKSILKK